MASRETSSSGGQRNTAEAVSELQHHLPPSNRGLRAQSVHRLQVGLFGFSAMLLLVGLANIIMDRAQVPDADDTIEEVIAVDEPAKKPVVDPLADIGVVPAADPTPEVPEGEPTVVE